jgi:chromate transport protein ChrA
MIVVAVRLARAALLLPGERPDWMNLAILIAAIVLLLRRWNATWTIVGAGVVGWVVSLAR